jgi:deazaflavin-dependent oxidoreductase (nitroreductase family)
MRVEHRGRYALVASAGGSTTNPCWYYNLRANSIVDLQDGPVTSQWKARELFGDEKVEWSVRADAAYPFYVVERARARREIPIYLLEPASLPRLPSSPRGGGAAVTDSSESPADHETLTATDKS